MNFLPCINTDKRLKIKDQRSSFPTQVRLEVEKNFMNRAARFWSFSVNWLFIPSQVDLPTTRTQIFSRTRSASGRFSAAKPSERARARLSCWGQVLEPEIRSEGLWESLHPRLCNNRKSNGPKVEPWGIPQVICFACDKWLYTLHFWLRLLKDSRSP